MPELVELDRKKVSNVEGKEYDNCKIVLKKLPPPWKGRSESSDLHQAVTAVTSHQSSPVPPATFQAPTENTPVVLGGDAAAEGAADSAGSAPGPWAGGPAWAACGERRSSAAAPWRGSSGLAWDCSYPGPFEPETRTAVGTRGPSAPASCWSPDSRTVPDPLLGSGENKPPENTHK